MVCDRCKCVLSLREQAVNPHILEKVTPTGAIMRYGAVLCDSCFQKETESGSKEVKNA